MLRERTNWIAQDFSDSRYETNSHFLQYLRIYHLNFGVFGNIWAECSAIVPFIGPSIHIDRPPPTAVD